MMMMKRALKGKNYRDDLLLIMVDPGNFGLVTRGLLC